MKVLDNISNIKINNNEIELVKHNGYVLWQLDTNKYIIAFTWSAPADGIPDITPSTAPYTITDENLTRTIEFKNASNLPTEVSFYNASTLTSIDKLELKEDKILVKILMNLWLMLQIIIMVWG